MFRNYIDKYKNNIHFVSVCSNLQKVNESIQSRTHILKLDLPTRMDIMNIMNKIITNENIDIDNESKEYILKTSDNSIRLLINYLEKINIIGGHIDIHLCKQLVSDISDELLEQYIKHIKNNEINAAIQILYGIFDY